MRSKTSSWFVCKVRYDKVMEDGLQKKVTETYVIDALSFTEAEARITEEISPYTNGEFEVVEIDRAPFKEVLFMTEENTDTRWYKSKLQFITIDEKTQKEKRSNINILVEGTSLESARRNIDEGMHGTMADYSILSVAESSYIDVLEFKQKM